MLKMGQTKVWVYFERRNVLFYFAQAGLDALVVRKPI